MASKEQGNTMFGHFPKKRRLFYVLRAHTNVPVVTQVYDWPRNEKHKSNIRKSEGYEMGKGWRDSL